MNKYCINCKYYLEIVTSNGYDNYDKCKASSQIEPNLVTGQSIIQYRYCTTMRAVGELCDNDAKLFEPREISTAVYSDEDEHSPYFPN